MATGRVNKASRSPTSAATVSPRDATRDSPASRRDSMANRRVSMASRDNIEVKARRARASRAIRRAVSRVRNPQSSKVLQRLGSRQAPLTGNPTARVAAADVVAGAVVAMARDPEPGSPNPSSATASDT